MDVVKIVIIILLIGLVVIAVGSLASVWAPMKTAAQGVAWSMTEKDWWDGTPTLYHTFTPAWTIVSVFDGLLPGFGWAGVKVLLGALIGSTALFAAYSWIRGFAA